LFENNELKTTKPVKDVVSAIVNALQQVFNQYSKSRATPRHNQKPTSFTPIKAIPAFSPPVVVGNA
jgi:hypothetical protein